MPGRVSAIRRGFTSQRLRSILDVSRLSKPVARAPAAAGIRNEDAALYQFLNVTQRRVRRTLRELGVLRRRKESLESVQHAIDDEPLSVIDGVAVDSLPDPGLVEHRSENRVRAGNCALQTSQEPSE